MARRSKYTKEYVISLAKEFTTRIAFEEAHPGAHSHAYKHGYTKEAFAHFQKPPIKKRQALLIGDKINRLTLVTDLGIQKPTEKSKQKKRCAMYSCDCGNPEHVRATVNNVKKGNTKSCGKCRFFESPEQYGETTTECEVCGVEIKTKKNRVREGRGRFCSQKCLFAKREIDMIEEYIGFKHPDGKLTVDSFYKHDHQLDSNGNLRWFVRCTCDCGNPHEVDWVSVQAGRVTRCLSCAGEAKSASMNRLHELRGKKFGKLTVVGYKYVPGNNGLHSHYLCDCDCGTKNHPVSSAYALESGHTTSCGCLEGSGKDTYKSFKENKQHRESYCELYFVEVAGGPLQKIGISVDTDQRAIDGKYSKIYKFEKRLPRAKAWVVEQILHYETLELFPSKEDVNAAGLKQGYAGATELRVGLVTHKIIERIDFLCEQALFISWRSMYERYLSGHQKDTRKQELRKAIKVGLLKDRNT